MTYKKFIEKYGENVCNLPKEQLIYEKSFIDGNGVPFKVVVTSELQDDGIYKVVDAELIGL